MLSDHCRDFTREQLYALVWETPISRLAKSFGLSNVGLRKICERHNIPTPPLGYWAKLAHGKKVRRPALVAEEDGRSVSIRIYGRGWAVVTPEVEKDQVAAITASQLHPSIVVADNRPLRLHAITAATAQLRAAKMDREGFMKASPNDGVCLTVSDSSLDRALRSLTPSRAQPNCGGMDLRNMQAEYALSSIRSLSNGVCMKSMTRRNTNRPRAS